MSGEEELRPEVLEFARVMEARLRVHDEKRGRHGWRQETKGWLLGRLAAEVEEFKFEAEKGNVARTLHEAADVANFAMFVWDIMRQKELAHALATPTRPQRTASGRLVPPVMAPASPEAQPTLAVGSCAVCQAEISIPAYVKRTARSPDGRSHTASFCGSWCAQEYEKRLGVQVS